MEAPDVPLVEVGGRARADVAKWRHLCKTAWDDLPPEKRALYESITDVRNRERTDDPAGESGEPENTSGSDDDPPEDHDHRAPYVYLLTLQIMRLTRQLGDRRT